MKTFLLFTCFVLIQSFTMSQNTQADETETLFLQKRFSEVIPVYLKAVQSDTSNILLNHHIGVCYLHSRSQRSKALTYLERSVRLIERSSGSFPPDTYKYLADAYQYSYEFDKAIIHYEKYKNLLHENKMGDQKRLEEINWKIDMCKVGKTLNNLNGPIDLNNNQRSGKQSSNYVSDGGSYSVLSADVVKRTFTFKRESKEENGNEDLRYFKSMIKQPNNSDILKTDKTKFEKKNKNETTIAASYDGQIVLTYRDDNGTANLYSTCLNGNTWTRPEKVNRSVNCTGWEENEYVSADGNEMYFTSDRPGGYGGKDLYFCKKLSENEWSKAENLGPVINTAYDEEAPFIHPDGLTLYFSSNGRDSIGQYDIYISRLSEGNWTLPVNVSYPIDTTRDIAQHNAEEPIPPQTVKPKKNKKKKNAEVKDVPDQTRDNYLISFGNSSGEPLTLLKGEFSVPQGESSGSVRIIVRNNENGESNAEYFSDSLTRKYAIILPPGKNNNISFQKKGYMIFSENVDLVGKKELFEKRQALEIFAPEKGVSTVLNNIFYETDESTFLPASNVALNDLYVFLKMNPGLIVEINNTITAKDDIKIRSRLSKNRADALVKYLSERGIMKERMIAKGDAVKIRYSGDKSTKQMIELKIVENLQAKELLTTQ
jgi:outer membrane protein OmpA-like peptidoglycan-associated protein/tetratricopeptide (TPR) repeat protein